MRPIKFRGFVTPSRMRKNGEIVTGSLITWNNGLFDDYWIRRNENGYFVEYPVDEKSVAQLVGVDANGNEVYEGDFLIDEFKNETVAEIYDRPEKIARLTLKEVKP